jgi:cell division protein FtsW
MARRLKSDAVLYAATLILVVVGLTWVYNITASTKSDPAAILLKQAAMAGIGFLGLLAAMRIDYHSYANRRLLLAAAAVLGVALVAVLFGPEVKGGKRWLHLGVFGVQPSEAAKLLMVVFAATVLARRMENDEPLEPALAQAGALLLGFAALIVLERDLGTMIVLVATCFAMAFAAGLPARWIGAAALAVPPPLMALLWFHDHSRLRLQTWLDPYRDAAGDGYQTLQSYVAIGTGGLWGRGLNGSVQKRFYLPEAHNDYIFAVIAEEMGLIGACVIVACFALIVARGLLVARRAPDAFGSLLALGITSLLGIQAIVNLGVVTGLLPAKGITLPFVSYGGSSMIVSLVAMGVLLNVSQQASVTE